ncbi:MAG: hypothetical protein RIR51_411 [Bacteroidota bacterium]|jgi:hypothetical protein
MKNHINFNGKVQNLTLKESMEINGGAAKFMTDFVIGLAEGYAMMSKALSGKRK